MGINVILVKNGFFKQLDLPCDNRKEYNLCTYAMLEVSFITTRAIFLENKYAKANLASFQWLVIKNIPKYQHVLISSHIFSYEKAENCHYEASL